MPNRRRDSKAQSIKKYQKVSRDKHVRVSTATLQRQSVPKSKPSVPAVRGSWPASLLAIAVLLSGAGLITGGIWLSLQLFVNPDAADWVNTLLPEWAKIPLVNRESYQTLKQIRASIRQLGQIPGEPVPLETDAHTLQPTSLLLPVLSSRAHCQIDCEQIVELRVYQLSSTEPRGVRPGDYYQIVSQVPVQGPEESFVIAPLVDAETANQGSSRPLPLTELRRFEGTTPAPGVWLYLSGQRVQGGSTIAYGQVVHYNPSRSHLSLMLPWTSPTGQVPQWQQVTGGGSPELVVDQTIDLEPQLNVYQVEPSEFFLDPLELELISLLEPALKSPAYRGAILIARSGLWSPAWQWLQFIKRQRQEQREPWSTAAQAQMDLIRLHAQLTKIQADKTWASPSQELLADLIDGRWGEGLQLFQASAVGAMNESPLEEITTLLEADSGRLWNRVEAALRVNPKRTEVKAWGALIMEAKEGRRSAIAWLKQQPTTTPATVAYIQNLLRRLEGDFSTAKIASSHTSRIVGSVEPVTKVNPAEWLQPGDKAALKLADQQWYQVQIAAYNDGKRWRRTPFSDLQLPKAAQALSLWQQLGLDTDPQIQMVVWLPDGQQETTIGTVKAVQLRGGVLRLLAAFSETTPNIYRVGLRHRPLALTEAALKWVQPNPITLAELTQQQQPLEVTAILPALWGELQKLSPSRNKSAIPSFEQMQQQLGQWPVQLIDLTGDALPEVVLTVSPEAIATLKNSESGVSGLSKGNQSRPRTIIFSNTGGLLYSEFSTASGQSVTAIAELEDDEPPALLVEGSKVYSLQRWSAKRQRFE